MWAPPSAVVVVVVWCVWGVGQATTTWVCKHNNSKYLRVKCGPLVLQVNRDALQCGHRSQGEREP
jgi:hypothetical protein